MRSLVYHAGALGDFVTSLPALTCLRQFHPADHIVLWGRLPQVKLALAAALADEVRDLDDAEFAPYFGEAPDEETIAPLRKFDSALLFTSPDSPLARNFRRADGGVLRVQPPFPDLPLPIVDYHLSLFEPVPPPGRDVDPFRDFRVRLLERTGGPLPPSGEIVIHPGSGSLRKNWPLENFTRLAGELEQAGFQVAWLAGPAEKDWNFPASCRLFRCLDLVELARRLASTRLFIGNDAGTTHLASAMGSPTVALFLASDPSIWAPRGKCMRVVDLRAVRTETEAAGSQALLQSCLAMLQEKEKPGQWPPEISGNPA